MTTTNTGGTHYFYVSVPQMVCPRCSDPRLVVVSRELLEKARLLTHPDLHGEHPKRARLATKLTAAINGVLQS